MGETPYWPFREVVDNQLTIIRGRALLKSCLEPENAVELVRWMEGSVVVKFAIPVWVRTCYIMSSGYP